MATNTWRVALTFDTEHPDRPADAGNTERVLAVLAEKGVRATHFLQGRWVEAYPELARRIADEGHLIGNHSHSHVMMPWLTADGRLRDVRAAERTIRRVTGQDPRPWFRCPFGEGTYDADVLDSLERLGYREIRWDVDSNDWRPRSTGPGVRRGVVAEARAFGDGAIVLMHPWTNNAHRSLGGIIDDLRGEGAVLVGVDELEIRP